MTSSAFAHNAINNSSFEREWVSKRVWKRVLWILTRKPHLQRDFLKSWMTLNAFYFNASLMTVTLSHCHINVDGSYTRRKQCLTFTIFTFLLSPNLTRSQAYLYYFSKCKQGTNLRVSEPFIKPSQSSPTSAVCYKEMLTAKIRHTVITM